MGPWSLKAYRSIGARDWPIGADTKGHAMKRTSVIAITKDPRTIASHWHGGQGSGLYSFCSTGRYVRAREALAEITSDIAHYRSHRAAWGDRCELIPMLRLQRHLAANLPPGADDDE